MVTELGKKLRELREDRGWAQKDLADAAKIPQPTLSKIESGVRPPRQATLEKLAAALSVPLQILESLDNKGVNMVQEVSTGSGGFQPYKTKELPLLGRITVGKPFDNGEVLEMVPILASTWRENAYVLRVEGDSMADTYQDDDWVIIDHRGDADLAEAQNRICAVEVNGKSCLKIVRVKWRDDQPERVTLESRNSRYKPIEIKLGQDDFHIRGFAREIVKRAIPKFF